MPLSHLTVNSVRLAHFDASAGPALVFLHGFPLDHTMWNAQIVEVNAEGATFKWYVDPATGRIIKKVFQGRQGEQTMEFNEWKNVNGINLPVAFTMSAGGQPGGGGKLTTIEINPTVDPKVFEKPVK